MPSLKEPQKSIPGGFVFWQPETKWAPTPFSSLDSIAQQLIAHRSGRPDLIAKHNWPMDLATVRQEVEQFNIAKCVQMGWTDYLLGGSEGASFFPTTIPLPHPLQRARNVVAGRATLVEWKSEGAPTVAQELADRRARACCSIGPEGKKCPFNGEGGWESYFTVPASNAIRHELEKKKGMKLETPDDANLGTCTACTCPLPLKVWLPLENILKKMLPEAKAALHPACWIREEEKALTAA